MYLRPTTSESKIHLPSKAFDVNAQVSSNGVNGGIPLWHCHKRGPLRPLAAERMRERGGSLNRYEVQQNLCSCELHGHSQCNNDRKTRLCCSSKMNGVGSSNACVPLVLTFVWLLIISIAPLVLLLDK